MADFIGDLSAHIQKHSQTNPLWADTVAMATLSAVLEGIQLNDIYGPLNLNIYALCIGPSGLANKTVPMKNIAYPILEKAGEIARWDFTLPSRFSLEGFIEHLSKESSFGIILNDEFTHVLKEAYGAGYLSEILEFLSELYDGTAQKRYTKKSKLEKSAKVYVSFLSATTPYIYEVMKPEMFLQGTANRFLFVLFKDSVEKTYTPDEFFSSSVATQEYEERNNEFGEFLGELRNVIVKGGWMIDINRMDRSGQILLDYRQNCLDRTKALYAARRPKDFIYSYLVRQPEICLKIAGLKAVSEYYRNFFRSPIKEILISESHAQWAVDKMRVYEENFMRMQDEWARHNVQKEVVKTLDNYHDQIRSHLKEAGGVMLVQDLKAKLGVRDTSWRDSINTMLDVEIPDSESERYKELQKILALPPKTGRPPVIVAFKQKKPQQ